MTSRPQPIIVCAACRYNGLIVCGARHYDMIMSRIIDTFPEGTWKSGQAEQGFIDQFGEFHDREAALEIVTLSGQNYCAERNGGYGRELFSEGLY